MLRRAFFIAVLTLAASAALAAPRFEASGHALHRPGPIGVNGWGQRDLDGDGREDLVVSSNGPAALVLVYGRRSASSTVMLKQSLVYRPGNIAALTTLPAGEASVAKIGIDRSVTLLGGWPLAPLGSFQIPHHANLARAGDIDADGTIELVVAGAGTLSVFSLPGGELEWSVPQVATDIELHQLDGDPALELIIAGGDSVAGVVLDGITRVAEWTRPEGFGMYVAAGQFGGAGQLDFVGARDWQSLSGFASDPYQTLWSIQNFDTDGVAVGDTDADGHDEFAVGDGQWGKVRVYETPSLQVLYEIPNRGHGMWALDFLDLDADAREEIWYSARTENSSNRDINFGAAIVNPFTGATRLTIQNYPQGASASGLFDLNRDGRLEWVQGTFDPFASTGMLRVLDADSHALLWQAPHNQPVAQPFDRTYRSLHSAQLDLDPALELVAVGASAYQPLRLLLIDGATFNVDAAINVSVRPQDGGTVGSRLLPAQGPGSPSLLVLGEGYTQAGYGVALDVFSLPAGVRTWSHEVEVGFPNRALGLDAGQLDGDAAHEYVLVHSNGVVVVEASQALPQWSQVRPSDGAVILARSNSAELLVWTEDGEVDVHDGATGQHLRSFALEAPLEKLVALPGETDSLLAISGEKLKWISTEGTTRTESGWIGSAPPRGENVHVVESGDGWRLSVGRSFTTWQFQLVRDDRVFADGFE